MKIASLNPYAQAGKEVLEGGYDHACYAAAISQANGNIERATGLYIAIRTQNLQNSLNSAVQSNTSVEMKRLRGMMNGPRCESRHRDVDLFRPSMLLGSLFLGSLSLSGYLVCRFHAGVISNDSLKWIVLFTLLLTLGSLVLSTLLRLYVSKSKFYQMLMPFAAVVSIGSILSATHLVKSGAEISWQSSEETKPYQEAVVLGDL